MFYARLGVELLKAMEAVGYGKNPPEDLTQFNRGANPIFSKIMEKIHKSQVEDEGVALLRKAIRSPCPRVPEESIGTFLSKEVENMKPFRSRIRIMAERVDQYYGFTDHGEPHRMFHHHLLMLTDNPYQPLRKLDYLFEAENVLLPSLSS